MKNFSLVMFAVFGLIACETDLSVIDTDLQDHNGSKFKVEEAFPDAKVELITLPSGVIVSKVDSFYFYDGDILLSQDQLEILSQANIASRSAVLNDLAKHWSSGMVYYAFSPGFSGQQKVLSAIAHWQSYTSLRFYPRTNQKDYILFKDSENNNSSALGKIGGAQDLYLAKNYGSDVGTAIHEIGHAVGLFHEQSRNDRDKAIIIHWGNILPGKEHNFKTMAEMKIQGFGWEINPFDFNSIMLYSSFDFSIDRNKKPTMTKKDGTTFSSQRDGLSQGDIEGVKFLYGPPYAKLFVELERINEDIQSDTWEKWDYDYSNHLKFYSDKECKNPVALTSPRLIRVQYRYNYGNGEYKNSRDIVIPTGARTYDLGSTYSQGELSYGNYVNYASSYYYLIGGY